MIAYPVSLEDENGELQVISTDFPEFITFREDRSEAIARPVPALEESIAAQILDHKNIPTLQHGSISALLPTLKSVKAIFIQG